VRAKDNPTEGDGGESFRKGNLPQFSKIVSSQQVHWWSVHTYVAPWLETVGSWPTVGTPEWCALPDDHPTKLAALYDAAQHWALRLDACQEARAEASRAVSGAVDWRALSREINSRADFYAVRPWLRRVVDR
jgi:Protein of unknown function (DUF2742)